MRRIIPSPIIIKISSLGMFDQYESECVELLAWSLERIHSMIALRCTCWPGLIHLHRRWRMWVLKLFLNNSLALVHPNATEMMVGEYWADILIPCVSTISAEGPQMITQYICSSPNSSVNELSAWTLPLEFTSSFLRSQHRRVMVTIHPLGIELWCCEYSWLMLSIHHHAASQPVIQ